MAKELKDSDFGIKILRQGENDSIDIVAVSGIGAHPDRTWTMKKNVKISHDAEEIWVNWLADDDMLPSRLPNARIMRFGYRSEWFGPKELVTKKTLVGDVAQHLLKGLEIYREDPCRPLLFVAHSFGGHVVICALRKSFDSPNRWAKLFDSTAGLVFLGTPFRGRQGVSLSDMIKTMRKAHPNRQIWQETMEFSTPSNPFLLETVELFMKARVKRSLIPIACFYEGIPSPLWKALQINDLEKDNEKVYVVPKESACLDLSPGIEEHYVLDRDHYKLNKFCEAKDVNFLCVADSIERMAKGAIDFLKKNCSQAHGVYKTNFSLAGFTAVKSFVDRPDEMKALENKLLPKEGSRRKVFVLHGLGGIGKTQLSIEFARQFQHKFSSVFWLNADTKWNVEQSVRAFAQRIPAGQVSDASRLGREQHSISTIMSEVREWLSLPENTDWLAIADNLDHEYEPNLIRNFIPDCISDADHGSILFTTRLAALGQLGSSLEVGKMNTCQAQTMLESLLQKRPDPVQCKELLNRLDGLPLAIAQAGAFLRESGMKLEDYIEVYDRQFTRLMDDNFGDKQLEYRGSVWTTWIISFNSIKSQNEIGITAANLLIFWSCLDNKNFRQELFSGALEYQVGDVLPSWMIDLAVNVPLKFSRAIQLLRRYSMVEEIEELGSYSIHPVVHKWIYHYCYDEIRTAMGRTATILLWDTFERFKTDNQTEAQVRMIPHIRTRLQNIPEEERTQVRDSSVAQDFAYTVAKRALRRTNEIFEDLVGLAEELSQRTKGSERPYDHTTLQAAQFTYLELRMTENSYNGENAGWALLEDKRECGA